MEMLVGVSGGGGGIEINQWKRKGERWRGRKVALYISGGLKPLNTRSWNIFLQMPEYPACNLLFPAITTKMEKRL